MVMTTDKKKDTQQYNIATHLAHYGSAPHSYNGLVNPPVHRASTIIIEDYEGFQNCFSAPYRYGREGTPSTKAFERAIADLDQAYGAIATSSGLSAITSVLLAFTKIGAHILLPDNFYGFSRQYADETLGRYGINVTYYKPMISEQELEGLITPETSLIYIEAPGSLTYEVSDIGMIVDVAKRHNIPTACDNSWGTPINFSPMSYGIDVSIMSATKYINGHSDIMLGVISCKDQDTYETVLHAVRQSGNCPGSEEIYLGLRGLRTLSTRMEQHKKTGLMLAEWLSTHPTVKTVLHPAFPSCPGHQNWQKYFKGTSGVFAIVLHETSPEKIGACLDALHIFKMGFSWGGFESLIFPEQLSDQRLSRPWDGDGFLMRIHAGLEDPQDLKSDLEAGLAVL